MSSVKHVRITPTECLRFPTEGSIRVGLVGPKPRPKGVGDGQLVNIPVPPVVGAKRVTREGSQPSVGHAEC